MNHNTIFRAKRLGIVTLKFWDQVVPVITRTRKARNFRFYKWKLSRINASFLVQVKSNSLEEFEKMTGSRKSYCPFISKSLHIHFNPSQNVSPSYCLMVWSWLQMKGQLLANVSNKETEGGIHSYLAWILDITCHEKLWQPPFFPIQIWLSPRKKCLTILTWSSY